MSKVTWSVPLVQFGRFEVEFDLEGAQNHPRELGRQYALFIADVMLGFEAEQKRIREGASVDAGPIVEAVKRIAEGDYEEAAKELIKSELGATEISEDAPPWEQPAPEKSEPWKNQGPVKKPAKIDW